MEKHPIENIMRATLENIKGMIDVNTVVGSPVVTPHGKTVIPISRVSFGFGSGGGEYDLNVKKPDDLPFDENRLPFAGGSGAGVSITPVGFLVVEQEHVSVLRSDGQSALERATELAPKVMEELRTVLSKCKHQDE